MKELLQKTDGLSMPEALSHRVCTCPPCVLINTKSRGSLIQNLSSLSIIFNSATVASSKVILRRARSKLHFLLSKKRLMKLD